MRAKQDLGAKDIFQQRAEEKEAQRRELFGQGEAGPQVSKEYVRQQVEVNPRRIKVGKPTFRNKF